MKILIRMWDQKYYVWKDAICKNGTYYVGGIAVSEVNVMALETDDNTKYVVCKQCGEYIKDDPKSIEEHFAKSEKNKDCFNCSNCSIRDRNNTKINYVKNDDGTYHQTVTQDVVLYCSNYYPGQNIDTIDVVKYCKYYKCRRAGVQAVVNVFSQYPGMFDKSITVDLLKAKGFEYEKFDTGFFEYDLKMRNTLKACVNELGIVDHFIIKHRGYTYKAYYSAKYDKIFYSYNGKYIADRLENVSQAKHDQSKAKISALYKEASK